MAKGMGPHQPKPGWPTRWPKQALQLALASPGGLLIMLTSIIVAAAARGALVDLGLNSFGRHMMQAFLGAALLPALILTVNQIMRADGRGAIPLSEILELSRRMAPAALATLGAMCFLSWLLPDPPRGAAGGGSDLSRFLGGGISVWVLVEMICCMLNPFWLGSSTALKLGFNEALTAHNMMIMRVRAAWLTAVIAIIWVSGPLIRLPVEIVIPLLYFRICWQYVAAREVMGGIDDNGIEERSATPSYA